MPATVPPEAVAETIVEFAGVGKVIFRLLMFVTLKPDAELGTEEEPGVRVIATAEPVAAEPGAVPVTDVVMLEVWPMPKIVPWQLQFTLTGAALAGDAKQKTDASAIGATTPERSSTDAVVLITISKNAKHWLRPELSIRNLNRCKM
ncbi:hypothetical protein [Nocardia jejuensis]|uniref:hypothetical protein n=1 Tax=Nocardia jejuensis TaxID=328049 RepID=UPI0012F894BA|nr:hypothetical protein [Nocardia jejuensis]